LSRTFAYFNPNSSASLDRPSVTSLMVVPR
jgi:hypothetical protein